MDSLVSRILSQILIWLEAAASTAVLSQLLALFVVFLLALIGRQPARRLPEQFKQWLVRSQLAPESSAVINSVKSSLNFELLVWLQKPDQIPLLSSDLRHQIWEALAARNIEIAFPQRNIHIRTVSPDPSLPQAVA